jgi:UDP-MurNAc hydroxylase
VDFVEELLGPDLDGVYISHLHPDHYDPLFLRKLVRRKPGVPIYIAEFAQPWLKKSLNAVIGKYSPVIEIPALTEYEVAPQFTLKVFASDTCNPLICKVNVPCHVDGSSRTIDSIGVFSADGFRVVNANDAMGVDLIPKIAANIGKVDLLMGHYGGASPFPQCFPDISDKYSAAKKVIDSACKMLVSAADAVNASHIMPFAGQYVLGGRLFPLNSSRASLPLDKAVIYLRTLTSREVVSMHPSGFFDLSTGSKSPGYVEPDASASEEYFKRISAVKFSYEKSPNVVWENPAEALLRAAKPVVERATSSNVSFQNSFVIGDGNNWVTINLGPDPLESSIEIGKKPKFDNTTVIEMDQELLRRLCIRSVNFKGFTTLHWNQADVGSHFTWQRFGNFDKKSHMLLNFFGT